MALQELTIGTQTRWELDLEHTRVEPRLRRHVEPRSPCWLENAVKVGIGLTLDTQQHVDVSRDATSCEPASR